ncbi:MAG: exopolyphosphatase [Actinomycetia bacterium]|nr:exopolyphosphatase [Actinomycetes bacterium]
MRLAAIDLGSNSFHLLVADVHPDGTFESITREKEMLRLGDEVSRYGRITDRAIERAVDTVRRFQRIAEADGARDVIAKATSAIRSAANGSEVVDLLEEAAGVDIEVISGLEEARLIFQAVRASVVLDPPPALCIDIGGGSVEFMVGDPGGLRWAASEHLGVGRLTAELVENDPPSKTDRKRLEDRIRSTLEPLEPDVAAFAPQSAVGSSGTLNDLARMVTAARTGEVPATSNGLRISRADFLPLHERIMKSKTSERRRMPGLEEQRADLLPAGSTLLAAAMEVFGFDELTTSDWALREGIVLDVVRTHDPDDWSDDPRALRRAAVAGLARRCNSAPDHTRHVMRLALSLFDQTASLHELGAADREMLEYTVMLHDIGQHVSRKGHHRHAAYLVENAQLRGFSPDEVALLAALVRHHRRGDPKSSEARMAALSPEDRERVRKIDAILRVADGLDRGRRGVVERLDVEIHPQLVLLRMYSRGDAELECWGARRKRELFEKVFGRELELIVASPATMISPASVE